MSELLLPRTDAGVALQVAVAAAVYLIALLVTWRSPEFRQVVVGLATLTAAFFALRTLH